MKRFTDTAIWQDEWFMNLPPDYKLAFIFIKDNCDCAGIWKPNKRLANMMIGMEINWDDFLTECGERIKIIQGGYWWIVKFVDFQYGKLSEKCKPHLRVIETLKKYQLLNKVNKEYTKGIETLEEKEEYKEEEKEEEEDKEEEEEKEEDKPKKFSFKKSLVEYGFNEQLVDDWLLVRKNKKATNSQTAFKGFISEIEKRTCNINEVLSKVIEKSWSGFKWEWMDGQNNSGNGKQNSKTDSGITIDTIIGSRKYD